jgi:hypothetical protein
MNASSRLRAWTNSTSASPLRAVSIAAPVPCGSIFTVIPKADSNVGTIASSSPVSYVEVVVARMSSPSPIASVSCAGSAVAPSSPVVQPAIPIIAAAPAPPRTCRRVRCVMADTTQVLCT